MNTAGKFNIRVYGLLINKQQEVLVTDEYRMGMYMTKFPGGGLEFGEGTIDCLQREFREELNIGIEVIRHFYTTDYFQKALFFEGMQLLSIYYLVHFSDTESLTTTNISNNIPEKEGAQSFRWMAIEELNANNFTFPIDKKVAELLKTTM